MNPTNTTHRSISTNELRTALHDVGGPPRADYLADIVTHAARTRQRPGWATSLPVRRSARGRGMTLLAAAALLIVGGALAAGSGILRLPSVVPPVPEPSVIAVATASPEPSTGVSAIGFVRPFEYVVPATSTLERTLATSRLYGFTEGSNELYPRDEDGAYLPGTRGITVAGVEGAVTHPCPGVNGGASRVPIRSAPLAFLEDLRSIGGAGVGIPTATTIDGRPGLTVDVLPSRAGCETSDFHVAGGGLTSGWVYLSIPARLWLVEVNGSTVVVQAWAPTTEDLEAWLPVASEFIGSMRFTSEP